MSETHAVIISIVGTTERGSAFADELHALMDGLHALIPQAMPTFVLAAQPASVTTHELLAPPEHRRVSFPIQSAEHDIIEAARKLKKTLRGDGNGRCWCNARAADELSSAIDRWERFPEG